MKVRVARKVAATPQQVFAAAADPVKWPWGGRMEHLEGAGAGAVYRVTDFIGPHEVVSTLTITACEPPHRLAWRTHHEAFDHASELRIEPHAKGCRLVSVDEDRWHHAPWWAWWSARKAMQADMRRRLAALEDAVARAGTAPAGRPTGTLRPD